MPTRISWKPICARLQDHQLLLDRIPEVPDLRSAWVIVLQPGPTTCSELSDLTWFEEFAEGHE